MSQTYRPSNDEYILYNQKIVTNPEEFTVSLKKLVGESEENLQRGTAIFFDYSDKPLVLKHYYRGGLMAKLSRDKYFRTRLTNTRVYKEWQLLETMNLLNLPVPVPVAARVTYQGLFYGSDLITQRIMNARPFGDMLKINSAEDMIWYSLGQLIQNFHRHGVYHADLNANNILITDTHELYLIDFDKGRLRMKSEGWMNKVLKRLERSLYKFKNNNSEYQFSEENWKLLIKGYMG